MNNNNESRPYQAGYHIDAVGRRRKLSAGAMEAIRKEFYNGAPAKTIAREWGVSVSLILSVCYNTPRKRDLDRLGPESDWEP